VEHVAQVGEVARGVGVIGAESGHVVAGPLGIRSDCHRSGRNLVDQLEAAYLSWKAYYQSLPAPCSAAVSVGAYTKRINPLSTLTTSAPGQPAATGSPRSAGSDRICATEGCPGSR
jgi:hypothetical protein